MTTLECTVETTDVKAGDMTIAIDLSGIECKACADGTIETYTGYPTPTILGGHKYAPGE